MASIWSPGARGAGFDLSVNKFTDDETYRSGGIAWAAQTRRTSHSRTEPPTGGLQAASSSDGPRRASVNGPALSGFGSLYPVAPSNHFTGPSISLLDQFGGLADATRAAERLSLDPSPPRLDRRPEPRLDRRSLTSPPQISPSPPSLEVSPPRHPSVPPAPQPANGHINVSKRKNRRKRDIPIIDELRKSGNIADVIGHVLQVSTDQYGSRFIQERFNSAPPDVKDRFFAEACTHCIPLSTDVFGNYVVQQLFQLGTPGQRTALVQQFSGHVLTMSLHMYGCRVIQMALKYSPDPDRIILINQLRDHVIQCIKDHNGNHVIQKSIECINADRIQFIFHDTLSKTVELSCHTYGCRVVQRILEHADGNTKQRLLDQLKPHIRTLSEDQYGNYIIQHIVDNGPVPERTVIFDNLIGSIVQLSSHKYASNVVEKCFINGNPTQREQIIDRILAPEKAGPPIIAMIKDQYANYVVQKILDTAKGDEYTRLINAIKPHLGSLKRNSYGKHLASVERLLNVC